MGTGDRLLKYKILRDMLDAGKEHDQIMTYIENSGITFKEWRDADLCNSEWDLGLHPLMLAVEHKRSDIMNSLIRKGFDPHVVNDYEEGKDTFSLIHHASSYGANDLIKSLVEEHHVDVNLEDGSGYSPVITAIHAEVFKEVPMITTVKILVENGADVIHSGALAAATLCEDGEMAKYLISCGANVNQRYLYMGSIVSILVRTAYEQNNEMAKLLVEAGASIEGSEGRKLLLIAVAHNDIPMVAYCSSLGIDLDWEEEALPAVNVAVETGSYEVARYLVVDVSVSLERKGTYNQTAFEMAFMSRETDFVELFIKAGYSPYKESCLSEDFDIKASYIPRSLFCLDRYHECHNTHDQEEEEEEDLQELRQNVLDSLTKRTLQNLCVFQIRKSLGLHANQNVHQLPLPTKLKQIVQLDSIPRNALKCPFMSQRYGRLKKIVNEYDFVDENAYTHANASDVGSWEFGPSGAQFKWW